MSAVLLESYGSSLLKEIGLKPHLCFSYKNSGAKIYFSKIIRPSDTNVCF